MPVCTRNKKEVPFLSIRFFFLLLFWNKAVNMNDEDRQTGSPNSAFLKYGSMNLNKSTSKRWTKGQPFWELLMSNFGMKLRWLTNSSHAKLRKLQSSYWHHWELSKTTSSTILFFSFFLFFPFWMIPNTKLWIIYYAVELDWYRSNCSNFFPVINNNDNW